MIKIEVDSREATKELESLVRRAQNMSQPLRKIGAAWKANVALGFRGGRDPWGGQWAALRSSTLAGRRKGSGLPLRDTGRLSRSFSAKTKGSRMTLGTNVKYAATHQFGTQKGQYGRTRRGAPIPWGRIVKRPMLPLVGNRVVLPRVWADDAVSILKRHLKAS